MSDSQNTIGQQILEKIKTLEEMLKVLTLEKRLQDLENQIKSITANKQENPNSSLVSSYLNRTKQTNTLKESLDYLEDITTVTRDKNGKRTFILHRPTPNFEYEKFADKNEYETTQNTDWIAEIEAAETQQQNKNPVVSCYVHEDNINNIENSSANTGTWGELGANPNATKFKIWVKPGTYEIYKELRQ